MMEAPNSLCLFVERISAARWRGVKLVAIRLRCGAPQWRQCAGFKTIREFAHSTGLDWRPLKKWQAGNRGLEV